MPIRLQLATSTLEKSWLERAYGDWLGELADVTRASPLSGDTLARDQIHEWFQDRSIDLFVLRRNDDCVGFACVEKTRGDDARLREFYVIPGMRGLGVGSHAAALLFDRHAGRWQLDVLQSDRAALSFWVKVLQRYAPEHRREERVDGHLRYVFPSRSIK
jgi:predicted acetyltransferase